MQTITDFQLLSHGFDHAQYFQGCGTSFTNYSEVVTGAGNSEKEAFEDALEQLHTGHDLDSTAIKSEAGELSEIPYAEEMPEDSEIYYYYSIRYNLN